jgi:hypothetical protein
VRQLLAVVLCATLATPGCASAMYRASSPRAPSGQVRDNERVADTMAIAAFVKQLPVASRVRIRLAERSTVRGTFMGVTDGRIVVQPRTRIMEPAIEIPIDRVTGIEVEQPNNVGKTIAIGVATGAATALGIFLLILAIVAGD